mmetsp:Transcript_56759/g.83077  ORF Transcript_56759/g.83077 Transcript_56759/m.83077 type:complete len:99 (-) Transcript_56759:335-631(-)
MFALKIVLALAFVACVSAFMVAPASKPSFALKAADTEAVWKTIVEVNDAPRKSLEGKKDSVIKGYESDAASVKTTTTLEVGKVFSEFKAKTAEVLAGM